MITTNQISLQSQGHCDIIEITSLVEQQLEMTDIDGGIVTLFVNGSTAGITTIEYESGAISDLKKAIERIAPQTIPYEHDRRWGDGNGYAHVRAALIGASLPVPLREGTMLLGTWQQIVVLDFDNRPRKREIQIQISGM